MISVGIVIAPTPSGNDSTARGELGDGSHRELAVVDERVGLVRLDDLGIAADERGVDREQRRSGASADSTRASTRTGAGAASSAASGPDSIRPASRS